MSAHETRIVAGSVPRVPIVDDVAILELVRDNVGAAVEVTIGFVLVTAGLELLEIAVELPDVEVRVRLESAVELPEVVVGGVVLLNGAELELAAGVVPSLLAGAGRAGRARAGAFRVVGEVDGVADEVVVVVACGVRTVSTLLSTASSCTNCGADVALPSTFFIPSFFIILFKIGASRCFVIRSAGFSAPATFSRITLRCRTAS